jgi:hypothetical protein
MRRLHTIRVGTSIALFITSSHFQLSRGLVIGKHVARITFVTLAGILPLVGVVLAQLPRTQPDRPQTPQIQTPRHVNSDEDLRFFTGKISSNNGKYVLDGASLRGPYLLDDQKSAKQYDGKQVRVSGVLEAASNTIHVRHIEEAAGPAWPASVSFIR